MVRLAITVFVVLALVGPLKAAIYKVSGDNIDLTSSALDSLKLAASLGAMCLAATVAAAVAGHLFWCYQRIRPWAMGLAASAGLWGMLALISFTSFAIESIKDVAILLVVWAVFGIVFGYAIYREQDRPLDCP